MNSDLIFYTCRPYRGPKQFQSLLREMRKVACLMKHYTQVVRNCQNWRATG